MKEMWYVTELCQTKDGKTPTLTTPYDNADAAEGAYYSTVASKIADKSNLELATVILSGMTGEIIERKTINNVEPTPSV